MSQTGGRAGCAAASREACRAFAGTTDARAPTLRSADSSRSCAVTSSSRSRRSACSAARMSSCVGVGVGWGPIGLSREPSSQPWTTPQSCTQPSPAISAQLPPPLFACAAAPTHPAALACMTRQISRLSAAGTRGGRGVRAEGPATPAPLAACRCASSAPALALEFSDRQPSQRHVSSRCNCRGMGGGTAWDEGAGVLAHHATERLVPYPERAGSSGLLPGRSSTRAGTAACLLRLAPCLRVDAPQDEARALARHVHGPHAVLGAVGGVAPRLHHCSV